MNERLTLQDLVDLLAEKQEMTKKDAESFLRELITLISETIEQDEPVRIKDFGTFKLLKVNARKSVDVNTGEDIEIAAHYRLTFTADKSLREAINKPFAHFESVAVADGVVFENEIKQLADEGENDATTPNAEEKTVPVADKRKIDPKVEAFFTPKKDEEVVGEFDIATKRIGVVVGEITASVDAFEAQKEITQEDKRILNSMLLKKQTNESTETNNITETTNINDVDRTTPNEETPRKESLDERLSRLMETKHVTEPNVEEIREQAEPVHIPEEPVRGVLIDENNEQTTVNENYIYSEADNEPLYRTISPTETSSEPKQISKASIEDSISRILNNEEQEEIKHPIVKTKSNEMENKEPFDTRPQYEDKGESTQKDRYDSEYDDTYYDEYPSNTKTYIYWGVGILLVIALIFGVNYLLSDNDDAIVQNEIVADESDRSMDDSATLADEFAESDETGGDATTKAETVTPAKSTTNKSTTDLGVEVLKNGQTLRLISLKYYGHKSFWVYIYDVNKAKIDNPNNVAIGTSLTIPSLAKFNVDPKDPKEIQRAMVKEGELITRLAK